MSRGSFITTMPGCKLPRWQHQFRRAPKGLSPAMLVALGEKEVKTLDDLADLATDELTEIVGSEMTAAAAGNQSASTVKFGGAMPWRTSACPMTGSVCSRSEINVQKVQLLPS